MMPAQVEQRQTEPPKHLAKQGFHAVMPSMTASAPDLKAVNSNVSENQARVLHEKLMARVAQAQDKTAFVELFEYFAPRIKSYLMKNGSTPDQAEELAQETMIAVWDRATSFDPKLASVSTWIFTIARNKRIDFIRKFDRPIADPTDPAFAAADDAPNPREQIEQEEETAHIAQALKDLPEEQATLIYKSFFENKTHNDIAAETKLPLGTVKSRIRLALERLRKNIKSEDYGR